MNLLEALSRANAIEIDGYFLNHFNFDETYESQHHNNVILDINANFDGDEVCFSFTKDELEVTEANDNNEYVVVVDSVQFYIKVYELTAII